MQNKTYILLEPLKKAVDLFQSEQKCFQPGLTTVIVRLTCNSLLAYFHIFIFLEPSLAFSHSPGCMFLTDIQDPSMNPPSESTYLTCEFIPRCFLISHNPLLYSLASQRAVNKIRKMERIIGEDPGEMWNEQSKLAISTPSWVGAFQS